MDIFYHQYNINAIVTTDKYLLNIQKKKKKVLSHILLLSILRICSI